MATRKAMRIYAEKVAYLGTRDKIRAALMNEFGEPAHRLSDNTLDRILFERRREFERARELVERRCNIS